MQCPECGTYDATVTVSDNAGINITVDPDTGHIPDTHPFIDVVVYDHRETYWSCCGAPYDGPPVSVDYDIIQNRIPDVVVFAEISG